MKTEVEDVHVKMMLVERREDGAVARKHLQVKVLDPSMFSITEFRPDPVRGGKTVLISLSGVLIVQSSTVVVDNGELLPEEQK